MAYRLKGAVHEKRRHLQTQMPPGWFRGKALMYIPGLICTSLVLNTVRLAGGSFPKEFAHGPPVCFLKEHALFSGKYFFSA